MSLPTLWELALVALSLFLGGLLKGATGAGTPILAIPAMSLLFDVRLAIVVMMAPNVLTNAWQGWQYRAHLAPGRFTWPLVLGGVLGVLIGTWLLASLPLHLLSLIVALAVFAYIGLRLARPDWVLSFEVAQKLALPAGLAAGLLQGASGISVPASLTFFNAIRLPRPVFIGTISMLFVGFSTVQALALMLSGVARPQEIVLSVLAMGPIAVGMPVGAALARRLPPRLFDRAILILLAVIAGRLALGALL